MKKLNNKFSFLTSQLRRRKGNSIMLIAIVFTLFILSVSAPSATTGIGK